jgi:hypothetical protein
VLLEEVPPHNDGHAHGQGVRELRQAQLPLLELLHPVDERADGHDLEHPAEVRQVHSAVTVRLVGVVRLQRVAVQPVLILHSLLNN